MRRHSTNQAFTDLTLNLMLGFAIMFILAFLMINPIADAGKIDPDAKIIITLDWHKDSTQDMDFWVRGPDGTTVSFRHKDGVYMILDRDDLGARSDTININGEDVVIPRNIETVTLTHLSDGEYIVNVHHFAGQQDEEVRVELIGLTPFKMLYSGSAVISSRNEITMVTFVVENGEVVDIRTDISISLRGGPSGP